MPVLFFVIWIAIQRNSRNRSRGDLNVVASNPAYERSAHCLPWGLPPWRPQLVATTAYQKPILSDSLRLSVRLDRAEVAFALEDTELDSHCLSWRNKRGFHSDEPSGEQSISNEHL